MTAAGITLAGWLAFGAEIAGAVAPAKPRAAWQPAYCWQNAYGVAVPCAFVAPATIDL